MRLEVKKYLYDIQRAANLLTEFTHGKTFADYERDAMLRAAAGVRSHWRGHESTGKSRRIGGGPH